MKKLNDAGPHYRALPKTTRRQSALKCQPAGKQELSERNGRLPRLNRFSYGLNQLNNRSC
ncbi:hypothetical protein [Ignatzschineria sp. F8392]|uniref:hypothetical protein n=1 Tax=Ignatzschineria sp. F8392 TaxID=1980117 RepID=UPI00117A3F3D|nr:hypothetical protein [Ignatzschineria sp. F8392]